MAVQFRYVPPKIDAGLVVHGLVKAAETAGAHALLAASQPLVPVDEGTLKASGTVEHDGHGAAVSYSATNEADGYNYAAKQHEDETLNHPNGGQAHYLMDPMHTAHGVILAAMAAELRI
jgi:hypothetical protein